MHHVAPSPTVSMLSGAVDGRAGQARPKATIPALCSSLIVVVWCVLHLPAMRRAIMGPVVGEAVL